ncbi:hypothetical protein [Thermococcus sp. Bubb.Bath]|uniref:hypothetical protein n=1 Tax=Thermococcus sp. Bubb.Bath TaxID=1638242 RepID=UPI00143C73C0|nr:hypothetical protein [Thermococcus sp. Bubb.Bath]NJF25224.1 hypothetical protein [Thermococcus sp. Bubb.Bath]
MKGKAILLVLLLIGAYLYLSGYHVPDNLNPNDLVNKTKGAINHGTETSTAPATSTTSPISGGSSYSPEDNATVIVKDNETIVRFEVPMVDENVPALAYDLAKKTYAENGSKHIKVEAYFGEEPLLAVVVENGDFENASFMDIRRPEFRIETDLGLFDVLVENVTVTNESASVSLEYLAGEDSFWRDYARMSLAVLQDAPWVQRVEIVYLGERNVSVSIASDDLLRAVAGNMTPEEFANAVSVVELGS